MNDYKVVFMPAVGLDNTAEFEKEYATQEEAEAALNGIAEYTLFLHECSFMPDYSNYGMVLERGCGDDWNEIDGDGNLVI